MMDARTSAIAQTLSTNPLASGMLAVMSHEGQTDGMGYDVDHVTPGRGFSSREYASKQLPNGRYVFRETFYPGPFDGMAGYSTEITETFSVWVGWEEFNEHYEALYDSPPLALPAAATGWHDTAFDGPRHWYADFADAESAEAFATSLAQCAEDTWFPPLIRTEVTA